MSHKGKAYDSKTVAEAKRLLALHSRYPNNQNLTLRQIAARVGVSPATLTRWSQLPMDEGHREARQKQKGHNRKLSHEAQMVVAGWIVARTRAHKPTQSRDLHEFVRHAFGVTVSPAWVTRFIHCHHFSFQTPSKILHHEEDPDALEKGAQFIQFIRAKNKQPEQIVVIDKCKFYSDVRYVRHLAPKGWYV